MPCFFIDTSDGDVFIRDDEGHDLPDRDMARHVALDVLPDMARDKIPDGNHRTFSVHVRDHRGTVIYAATLVLNGGWSSGALEGSGDGNGVSAVTPSAGQLAAP